MKRLLFLSAFFVPAVALALTIAPANLYTDVRSSSPEAAGINMLSREGIVKGYGNGFFGVARQINRAEFLKIAMIASGLPASSSGQNCFPDVRSADWFSPFICAAKDRSIVRGINDGLFHPEYTVTYGEALKMLTLLFGYEVISIDAPHWAEPYYRAAAARGVDIPVTIDLDTPLTRGLAARLAAAFLAESKEQLSELRFAESGQYGQSSSSSMSSSQSSSLSSSHSSVSSSSFPKDPRSDTEIRSQFLLLGEVGPILGAASIFLEQEPLQVLSISINLTQQVTTVDAFLVYDDQRQFLGTALLDPSMSTNRTYKVTLSPNAFMIDKREERTVYARPRLTAKDNGGQSNQLVQISSVTVKGNGVWSNQQYTKVSSESSRFPEFVTARSMMTSVKRIGEATSSLVTGLQRNLGAFEFAGRKSDSSAHIDITSLTFDIGQTGGVSLTNVSLGSVGINEKFPCTTGVSQIVCSAIPDFYGSLTDAPRQLTVYGDIAASDVLHASLRLTLNSAGDPDTDGSISWSDGSTGFGWVSVPEPVGEGTYSKY